MGSFPIPWLAGLSSLPPVFIYIYAPCGMTGRRMMEEEVPIHEERIRTGTGWRPGTLCLLLLSIPLPFYMTLCLCLVCVVCPWRRRLPNTLTLSSPYSPYAPTMPHSPGRHPILLLSCLPWWCYCLLLLVFPPMVVCIPRPPMPLSEAVCLPSPLSCLEEGLSLCACTGGGNCLL